jgi:XTP/dITP diphosphohydrolase
MITLLIATRNLHKVDEIRAILGSAFQYKTLNDLLEAPNVVEDAGTFVGNATKKAVELAKWVVASPARLRSTESDGSDHRSSPPYAKELAAQVAPLRFVLADDSGLEVDCLQGAPGVHSARFAALDIGQVENSSAEANNAKLLRLMSDVPSGKRAARFRCVLALVPVLGPVAENASPVCYADEVELGTEIFEGVCEGKIDFSPRGKGGFGYDPLFIPEGRAHTFAELPADEKNRLSHRAKALAKLKQRLAVGR